MAAHDAVEVEAVVAAHDAVEVEAVVAAHDAVELVVHDAVELVATHGRVELVYDTPVMRSLLLRDFLLFFSAKYCGFTKKFEFKFKL